MKICLITMLLMIALHPVCFAGEEFYIEDETLKPVSDSITQVILSYEKDPFWKACKFIGKPIDLDGDGKATDFFITTGNACGWGSALGPIWFIRGVGTSYTVVLSDGGYSASLQDKKTKGLFDIIVSTGTAAREEYTKWVFNGRLYTGNRIIKDLTGR